MIQVTAKAIYAIGNYDNFFRFYMNKKFVAAFAAFLSCGAILSFAGCNTEEATIEYTLSDDGTYYIVSGVSGTKKQLRAADIPAMYSVGGGEELPVKAIGDEAFRECRGLYEVTLPEGIESIGTRAFMRCSFSTLIIPSTVQSIGYAAFGMCKSLREITIPANVNTISAYAFAYCSSLTSAVVQAQITDLKQRVFAGNTQTVGSSTFTDSALTELYLPQTLEKINYYALEGVTIDSFQIYFAGTEEEWNKVILYRTDLNEETNEAVETVLDKADYFSNITMHFNVQF
jgi:hypothetical protein